MREKYLPFSAAAAAAAEQAKKCLSVHVFSNIALETVKFN